MVRLHFWRYPFIVIAPKSNQTRPVVQINPIWIDRVKKKTLKTIAPKYKYEYTMDTIPYHSRWIEPVHFREKLLLTQITGHLSL